MHPASSGSPVGPSAPRDPAAETQRRSTARGGDGQAWEQYPLWWAITLHLAPGAALTAFIIAMHAAFTMEPLLALLLGVLIVLAPLELGYLSLYARRTSGSWSPLAAVDYRVKLPWKRLTVIAVGLAVWMIVLVGLSMASLDEWLAASVFAWVPEAIGTMATVDSDGDPMSTGTLVAFLALFIFANGLVGPITEELYFRGHLLPRIDRYGPGAPVINTVLFTIYHFHTPWRYPVVFLGYLPIAVVTWKKRSLSVGLAAHLIINNVFVLMLLASYLAQ